MNINPTLEDPDDAPKPPTTWERIESAAPRKSTDTPAELAELWRDRRRAIQALYERAGIEFHPETVVNDVLALMETPAGGGGRLSLGALLSCSRWDRFEQALSRWLADSEERIWPDLQLVVNNLPRTPGSVEPRPIRDCTDEEIISTWDMVTGSAAPCPPVAVIRRMVAR